MLRNGLLKCDALVYKMVETCNKSEDEGSMFLQNNGTDLSCDLSNPKIPLLYGGSE